MSDTVSDDSSRGVLPRRLRWSHIAPVIVGATLGGIVGLVLFGYPPARILLPEDEPGLCGRPDDQAVELASALHEAPAPPTITFQAARCGDGLRAWGAPLRPRARDHWMTQVAGALRGEPMKDVLADWRAEHHQLERQEQRLNEKIDREQQRLQAELAAVGMRSAISVLNDVVPDVDAEEVVGLAASVNELRSERETVRSEQETLETELDYARRIRYEAEILPPTTGAFSAALGAILGGLAVLIVLLGLLLLRAWFRELLPERS